MKYNFYFKIFNNVKSEHETKILAKLEIEALFGDIIPINNFVDFLIKEPLKSFTKESVRIQDIITMELPYGRIQGYFGQKDELSDISKLIQRLTYTREIFLLISHQINPIEILNRIYPIYSLNTNTQFFQLNEMVLFRFITNQYFLEKSEYISRKCKTIEEVEKDMGILLSYLTNDYYRIPSPSTSKYYRKLLDNLAIREETSLYLNHYMHPYKGKSHPKMIRSIINYILPEDSGVIMDNFSGSGTSLVEASLLGLNSLGVEINPLSVLMCKVKCQSYKIRLDSLKEYIENFNSNLKNKIKTTDTKQYHSNTLITGSGDLELKLQIPYKKLARIGIGKRTIQKIFIARDLINDTSNKRIKDFLLLSLSGSISDIVRRTNNDFAFVLQDRINDLYNRLYLFKKLNEILEINVGNSETICSDTRNMNFIKSDSVDAIINSPPYLTALDYIDNDYPQLILLDLVNSWDELDENMIGNPKYTVLDEELYNAVKTRVRYYTDIYAIIDDISEPFVKASKDYALKRIKKFILDMSLSFSEMHRVLKKNAKCAIIIGNNHFKLGNQYHEIPNDMIIEKIADLVGFNVDLKIDRDVHKSSLGLIQKEKILIFQK